MAIDFPNTPSVNDVFTVAEATWIWNGTVWKRKSNVDLIVLSATTSSTTANQVIDSTTAGAVKYVIRADDGASAVVTEILAVASGTSVSHTEYGRVETGASQVALFDVTVLSNNIRLAVTPVAATATNYRISKQIITV